MKSMQRLDKNYKLSKPQPMKRVFAVDPDLIAMLELGDHYDILQNLKGYYWGGAFLI